MLQLEAEAIRHPVSSSYASMIRFIIIIIGFCSSSIEAKATTTRK